MNDTRIMDRIGASLDELGLRYDRRDNDEIADIRVRFSDERRGYNVWFKLDHFGPDRANLSVRAYTPLSGDLRRPIPAVAIEPGRLAQLHVLLNLVNAQLRCGAFHVDPGDSDLTFVWAIPLEAEPTTELIDFALHMASAIDDMITNVRAVVVKGKPAWEVYVAHREKVNAAFEGTGDGAPDATPTVEPLDLDALIDPDGWDETEEGDDTDNGPTPFRRAV
jgi:hypothetical protein